jgi:hypothetical protein
MDRRLHIEVEPYDVAVNFCCKMEKEITYNYFLIKQKEPAYYLLVQQNSDINVQQEVILGI